jgi:hypothetical protein
MRLPRRKVIALCLGLLALGSPARAQEQAQIPKPPRPYRSGLWLENGAGTGSIHLGCSNCQDVTAAYGESSYLRIGFSLAPRVLLGAELFGLLSNSFNQAGTGTRLAVENVSIAPIVIWYPWSGGLFVKGGAGLAAGQFTVSPDSGTAEQLPARIGSSLTFGVGFDIPVFKWLSITANLGAYFTALGDFNVRGTLLDDAVGSMYNANFAITIR